MKQNWANWFEIPVTDFDRAKAFYESIFDINLSVHDLGALKMGIFPSEKYGCAICQGEAYTPGSAGPLVYLNANPDLSVVEEKIIKQGGSIIISKRMISPDFGYMALFKDTEGNRLALHSKE